VKRDLVDFVAPLVAGSLVGLAAVLTLLPIALAIGEVAGRVLAPDRPKTRDAETITPARPSVTPRSIVNPRSGDRKEIST
jgi:hypothetical protein